MELISTLPTVAEQARDSVEDFDQIVLVNQKRVYRVLVAQVGDSSLAEDLTQECFLRAFRSRSEFRGDSQVSTWLIRIAINLARDYHRSRRAEFWKRLLHISDGDRPVEGIEYPESIQLADLHATPERELAGKETMAMLWSAVQSLPTQQREIFVLRFVEEMPLQEIAESTNLRLGTVKCQLYRAIAKLRKELEGRK